MSLSGHSKAEAAASAGVSTVRCNPSRPLRCDGSRREVGPPEASFPAAKPCVWPGPGLALPALGPRPGQGHAAASHLAATGSLPKAAGQVSQGFG